MATKVLFRSEHITANGQVIYDISQHDESTVSLALPDSPKCEITSSDAALRETKSGGRAKPLAVCREIESKTYEIKLLFRSAYDFLHFLNLPTHTSSAIDLAALLLGIEHKADISVFTKDRRLYLTLHHINTVTTTTRPLFGKKITIPEYEIDLPAKSVLSERLPGMDLDLIMAACLAVVRLGAVGRSIIGGKGEIKEEKWIGWDKPKPDYDVSSESAITWRR
ncbi:hypothetical protein HK102_012475 [Quaeritorhiza haematococci]|nr:hypothetical protein HK102_012475 [Quaeritorhiza haematococci]